MPIRTVERPQSVYTQSLLAIDVWEQSTLTFGFPLAFTGYGQVMQVYTPFTEEQKNAVRAILAEISELTFLTFVELEVVPAVDAVLRFGIDDFDRNAAAFAYLPSDSQLGGDSWYHVDNFSEYTPIIGSYAYHLLQHEIGHSLGLTHPHEPEVGSPMPADHDWQAYTVMSYNLYVGGEDRIRSPVEYGQTYMLEDIAALQHAYGANYETRSDNTHYLFSASGEVFIDGVGRGDTPGRSTLLTIWDGGGQDTYDFSEYTRAGTIDLNPGQWSTYDSTTLAQLGSGNHAPGQVANAYLYQGNKASLIENAIGGSGNELILGNSANNTLEGRRGNDALEGGAGNDTLDGGEGDDSMSGGKGNDTYLVDSAGDQLIENDGEGTDTVESRISFTLGQYFENLVLALGAGDIEGRGNSLANEITGNDSANRLAGGLGNDLLDGEAGIDTAIFAGSSASYTVSQPSSGVFQIKGPDGSDMLYNVEFAQFDDQVMRLLPGQGLQVDFGADPASYMSGIRDFDGNDLGGDSGWLLIGQADVDGDGDDDYILVNREIGRFAEISVAEDGKVYFDDHGWAGETRVVGIYIDPLVASGEVKQGSKFDSQRRFQNDLEIENINKVLGADDYDGDGLQEVYFALTDGTAYLHAYMHADGNIQYANYQSEAQVIDYLESHGFGSETYGGWFA